MQEDGFSFDNASSDTVITETDKIKAVLAKAGVEVFEQSHIKKAFAGHRKKLINSITKELLETEFQNGFPAESVEAEAEDTKIQAICEVGKEAIG